MAPTKGGKPSSVKGKSKPTGKPAGKSAGKVTKPSSSSKPKGPIKATQQKTKAVSHRPEKKKRVYTDKELNIPALNGIRPAGVTKAKGVKKGKTFVDDKDGMMAILAMVQAEKEGDIESKIMRARHMEEIREAKRVEAEKREGEKKKRFEEVKDDIRKAKGDKRRQRAAEAKKVSEAPVEKKSKKRVTFG